MERHIKKPNPIAKEVRSRRFKSQVVQSGKLYNRKKERINTLKAAAIKLEEQMFKKIKNKLCELVCKVFGITRCICDHDCNCKKGK